MSKIVLKNVRCSYVFVTEPHKDALDKQGNVIKGKYGVQIILKKNDPQITKIKKLVEEAAKEKFGEKVKLSMLKLPLRDGTEESENAEVQGMYFMNANNTRKPGIRNRHNDAPDADELEEMCYSGCYFHVSINVYAFKVDGNKGVAIGLNNVMLRKAGDRLDGTTNAEEDFEEFADEDDSMDDDGLD